MFVRYDKRTEVFNRIRNNKIAKVENIKITKKKTENYHMPTRLHVAKSD